MNYEIDWRRWGLALCLLAAPLIGCGDESVEPGPDAGTSASFEDHAQAQAIIDDFASVVVVPTYGSLATALADLDAAVQTLAGDPSDANLEAARQAWVAARAPWEASEGFLFGPVDGLGLDPALDSWPVDRGALDAVIGGSDELTEDYVASLEDTLHGFHTAEYLLFGVGGAKTAADLSDREIAYLTAVTALLAQVGSDLDASWTTGVNGGGAYAEVFKSAGAAGDAITDPDAADAITAAQEALRTVQTTLEQDILPLFL